MTFDLGPFIFYEGGGAGGIWEAPFKNRMTPHQLTNFFKCPPPPLPYSGSFFRMTPPPSKKKPSLKVSTFLIFSIIPLLHVTVLTMKTTFTIPILKRAVYYKTQIAPVRLTGSTCFKLPYTFLNVISNFKTFSFIYSISYYFACSRWH